MRIPLAISLLTLSVWLGGPILAGAEDKETCGAKLGPSQTQQWRIGLAVTAVGGPIARSTGTTTVPLDWPEQRVKIVRQELSPGVTVSFKTINGTVSTDDRPISASDRRQTGPSDRHV